jgi:NADPH:quinone reductase-like Zn-dependent oxidoreductase
MEEDLHRQGTSEREHQQATVIQMRGITSMVQEDLDQPSLPGAMSAIRLHRPGDPAALAYEQIQTPRPGQGEVLVRVHAAGITRDELDWPVDRLPATPSYEFSGIVAEVGQGVHDVAAGQEVFALSGFDRDGAAAEYILVPLDVLAPKPVSLGHVESASLPLAGLSAWQGLFDHGRLRRGELVLIHGAADGVGALAVQLAQVRGASVVGTCSTNNVRTVRELGADVVIDDSTTRFEDVAGQVDLVFDTAGGDRLERSLAVLRQGGRLVSVASEPPQQKAAKHGVEAVYFVVEPNRSQLVELARLADGGELRPTIDAVFPLREARSAFERSLGGKRRGKIVLSVVEVR